MNQIIFNHNYPKLWNQKTAKLIAINILKAEDVQKNKELLEYDTQYFIPNESPHELSFIEYFTLPKTGLLIQLIFLGDKNIPFCTLRKHTPDKEKYYSEQVGYEFEIKIDEEQ